MFSRFCQLDHQFTYTWNAHPHSTTTGIYFALFVERNVVFEDWKVVDIHQYIMSRHYMIYMSGKLFLQLCKDYYTIHYRHLVFCLNVAAYFWNTRFVIKQFIIGTVDFLRMSINLSFCFI